MSITVRTDSQKSGKPHGKIKESSISDKANAVGVLCYVVGHADAADTLPNPA